MDGNVGASFAKGSKGSSPSSTSSGRIDDRRELGVPERERSDESGINGAAMARFDVALEVPCAQRSGDGVSPLRLDPRVPGLDEAAESGRGWGLNSWALALSSRGEERGDAGRLVAN